jgi:hypothetical protein
VRPLGVLIRHASMRSRASATEKNQLVLRHSARMRALNASMKMPEKFCSKRTSFTGQDHGRMDAHRISELAFREAIVVRIGSA